MSFIQLLSHVFSSVRSRIFLILIGGFFVRPAPGQEAATGLPPDVAALLAGQSAWNETVSLHSGVGYKDNLLLSRFQPEKSGFLRGGVEAFLWHPPAGRTDYLAFLNAEGTRYFSSRNVDHEAQAFLVGEWRYRIEEKFKFTLDFQSYYLDQIFDVSDTDAQRLVARLQVGGVTLGPALHWAFLPHYWIEARGLAKRETFRDGSNNNRYYEGEFRAGWRPGERFEASLGVIGRRRDFLHREQYTEGGRPITDTRLRIDEREEEFTVKATLDKAAHWKTVTRTGRLRYGDNGSGYFNYREKKFIHEITWSAGDWLARLEGSAKRLVYEIQTVGLGIAPPARIKEAYGAELRIERKINARWTVYAEYNWEHNRTNFTLADYTSNEGLLGAQWNWEN